MQFAHIHYTYCAAYAALLQRRFDLMHGRRALISDEQSVSFQRLINSIDHLEE